MTSDRNNLSKALQAFPSLLAVYDRKTDRFRYHPDLLEQYGAELEGKLFWDFLEHDNIVSSADAQEIKEIVLSLNEANSVFFKVFSFGVKGRHILSFTYSDEHVLILDKLFDQGDLDTETIKYDELTRLISRNHFCREIPRINQKSDAPYALFFFDINKFRAINTLFGFSEGDKLLVYLADVLRTKIPFVTLACRVSADRFAFLADLSGTDVQEIADALMERAREYHLPFDLHLNMGVYLLPKAEESGNSMLDHAMLAQSVIKGNYARTVNLYTETLRDEMLSEQEIAGEMNFALSEGQFHVYYQPQYNHSTGMLVGAEALVRWIHPKKGMISPGRFIPIFEKNSFITKLDFYVFEKVVEFLRRSMDNHWSIVPISVNFSKHDIFSPNFAECLEQIRKKHGVPAKYLRVEVTESILMGNNKAVNEVLDKLHACGYVVEMDDFGSGYSSLNALKDLDFDIIKLDMLFLENKSKSSRGGIILSSVINMAKWLNIPVIAEGVETAEQADFLRSIGCDNIQGYLYSKPLPEGDYEALLSTGHVGSLIPQMKLIDTLNSVNFWEPSSQETLIFSNFVGAAVIFNYDRKTQRMDILRVNKKYLQEMGMNLSENDIIHKNPTDTLDEENKKLYFDALERAIETGEEQECETWRNIRSDCCGEEHFYIRSNLTVIGKANDNVLFYSAVRNITAEKSAYDSMLDTERRFKMASEQAKIYFWEYTVATKEMRPCFRCMRDLGLPPVLRNYPDSAIERGIFPPEVAEMYRDWHVQVANGVKELEAIIPLTADRVPFHVRYTTEFDENGHPIKAYGSATLVVD